MFGLPGDCDAIVISATSRGKLPPKPGLNEGAEGNMDN